MKKKKILFAINSLGVGGAENLVIEQIAAISKERFDPYILTIYRNPEKNLLSRLSLPEGRYLRFESKGLTEIGAWVRLYRALRKERFDIVITNLFDTNLVVRILSFITGVPKIFSYEHNINTERRIWQKVADKILSLLTESIFVGSSRVLDFTSRQEWIPRRKFFLNHNAAALSFGHAREKRNEVLRRHGLSETGIYVVTAGRLVEQKGHVYLIQAAEKIKESGRNAIFLIFGEGTLRGELSRLIKEKGLEGTVILKGIAPIEEVLAMSDIFTLPSLWEGLSIALLQAMNAGCPVVATRISGTDEAVTDRENGLLVTAGDAAQLEKALARMLDDAALRSRLGASAALASSAFSIERNVERLEQAINGAYHG